MRQLCSPNHTMKLHMTDMAGRKVLTMDRPWTFNCCCCEWGNLCGKTHMDVYMGEQDEQKMIGSVRMPYLEYPEHLTFSTFTLAAR